MKQGLGLPGRRAVRAGSMGSLLGSGARGATPDGAIRLGLLTDMSSWGRDSAGTGSLQAVRMAVAEFGGAVGGRPIEILAADHQMRLDVGAGIARKWFDEDGVRAIIDVPNSAIGINIHNLARDRDRIALLSGTYSSDVTNQLCTATTAQFGLASLWTYWDLDERTRSWPRAFFKATGAMPSDEHAGCYSATLHYVEAVRAVGSIDTAPVMQAMRSLPVEDAVTRNGRLREDGRVLKDVHRGRAKAPSASRYPWNDIEILRTASHEQAFCAPSGSKCPLLRT